MIGEKLVVYPNFKSDEFGAQGVKIVKAGKVKFSLNCIAR
jgi:hypothetical protein